MKARLIGMVLALLTVASAAAQTGSMKVVVTGAEKQKLAGATVVLTFLETRKTWTSPTDKLGMAEFRDLPAGSYMVKASAEGLQPLARTNLAVRAGRVSEVGLGLNKARVVGVEQSRGAAAIVSGDSLAVIRAFLRSEYPEPREKLNVSASLEPLQLDSSEECLKGLSFKRSSGGGGVLPEELSRYNLRLVAEDGIRGIYERIAEGKRDHIWRLAGVAFDDSRRFAVIGKYQYCGNVCALSELVIFQKVNGKWRRAKRYCSQVVP